MKFGYDLDGKLVPIEQLELRKALSDLDAKLDAIPVNERPSVAARLRGAFAAAGYLLTPEDENVMALFEEGVLDMHNLVHHFGEHLVYAAMVRDDNA